jgi:hypothetical protein
MMCTTTQWKTLLKIWQNWISEYTEWCTF